MYHVQLLFSVRTVPLDVYTTLAIFCILHGLDKPNWPSVVIATLLVVVVVVVAAVAVAVAVAVDGV